MIIFAGGGWRSWARWVGLVATPTALAIAYALESVGQNDPDWIAWVAIGVGALLTFAAAVSASIGARRQSQRAKDAVGVAESTERDSARPANVFITTMAPVVEALQRVVDAHSHDRRVRKEQLKQLIVIVACNLGPRIRACFFQHDADNTPTGPMRVLRSTPSGGGYWYGTADRRMPPRKELRDDEFVDIAGIDRFKMLDERMAIFVKDISKTPPTGWSGNRDYKTFIAAPVATETKIFGLLCVDSTEAGDLSRFDVEVIRQLAQILAIGLSVD